MMVAVSSGTLSSSEDGHHGQKTERVDGLIPDLARDGMDIGRRSTPVHCSVLQIVHVTQLCLTALQSYHNLTR